MDQTCLGRKGGLAPVSFPLFQGARFVGQEGMTSTMSFMVTLLSERGDHVWPTEDAGIHVRFLATPAEYRLLRARLRVLLTLSGPSLACRRREAPPLNLQGQR